MDKLLRELAAQNFNALDETQLDSIGIYLNGLQAKLNEAKRALEANRKQEKWNKVREAIAAYVEAYDEIFIDNGYEGFYIDNNSFFDECGRIVNSD